MGRSGKHAGLAVTCDVPVVARFQRVQAGQHKTFDTICLKAKWDELNCIKCDCAVYVRHSYRGRRDNRVCRECRERDRMAGLEAALAVALRKKKMGIRW